MPTHSKRKLHAFTGQLYVFFGTFDYAWLLLSFGLNGGGAAVAALSSHAGRHQRALPDKRARRKPGWLDGTIDPKTAAQMAIQHTTGIEVSSCQLEPLSVCAHVIASTLVISTVHLVINAELPLQQGFPEDGHLIQRISSC